MHKYYMTLPGDMLALFQSASHEMTDDVRLKMAAYVPGIAWSATMPERGPDIVIQHTMTDRPFLADGGTRIMISTATHETFPDDLYHLLYAVIRRQLIAREMYPVHAACVGDDDGYRLIVGHSGSGKTTLAHRLVSEHGMKLFSGNKTVIRFNDDGTMTAIAGTRTMTALDRDLNRYAYKMNECQYTRDQTVAIASIDLVRINDGVEETQVLSRTSALHTLYPFFIDQVNADVIVNGCDILDGTVGAGAKGYLARNLSRSSVPVSKHAGSVSFLLRSLRP